VSISTRLVVPQQSATLDGRKIVLKKLGLLMIATGFALSSTATDKPPARTVVNQITEGVGITSESAQNNPRFVTTYADKSVWIFGEKFFEKSPQAIYCWVEEPNIPKCERVFAEMFPSREKKD
tara:strand:- start:454 stop:822 length:369 start_codon:yes stop_codon:yes gene_type:complete